MTTEANNANFAFFIPAVKPMLHRLDSSEDYSRTEGGLVKTQLGPSETAFIASQNSFYVAAIGEDRPAPLFPSARGFRQRAAGVLVKKFRSLKLHKIFNHEVLGKILSCSCYWKFPRLRSSRDPNDRQVHPPTN
jgi:hypothetical protein